MVPGIYPEIFTVRSNDKSRKMPEKKGFKAFIGMSEVARTGDLGKSLIAEALGVFFINYFGCMSCIQFHKQPTDYLLIGIAFGLVVMAGVQSLGHISGAHLNPAVTVGALATGKITIIRGLLYIIVQCIGAIAGTAFLKALTPIEYQGSLGVTVIDPELSVMQGCGVEFVLGFVLMFVISGVTDCNRPETKIPAPLAIGLTVTAGHVTSVKYTGASMNPARTLGAAVISNVWTHHWIYWLGPCLGGIAAALLYTYVFVAPPPSTQYSPVQMKRLDGKEDEQA